MAEFGRFLFERRWRSDYNGELERMNGGKIGAPFRFTRSVIVWANMLRTALGIAYRLALGIMNAFLEEEGIVGMKLSQFYDRCIASDAPGPSGDERFLACGRGIVTPSAGEVDVALDSTGLSLNKYGGWLIDKWGVKKVSGWIKLHVAVNADTDEILAFVITTERCGDVTCTDKLMELVTGGGHRVRRLLADAAYDSKANWRKYSEMGMKVCINLKSKYLGEYGKLTGHNHVRSHGCMVRGEQIARIIDIGREEWKTEIGYSRRWKVECTFSDLKRMLGDILRSRTMRTNVLETFGKVTVHNEYKRIRRSFSGA
jgi:IS5 family transposase